MKFDKQFDVVVVGGGPSGVCASVSAARLGVRVLLIEQNGFSGGMATAGLVGPFMTCYDKSGEQMIIRGLFEEVVNRLVECDGAIHPSLVRNGGPYTSWIIAGHDHCTPFDSEKLKLVYDEMLLESGVEIMYHTSFVEAIMDESNCIGVVVHSKSGNMNIKGRVIIDCTGDGDVAASAGADYVYGSAITGKAQPATMFFRVNNVNSDLLISDIEKNRNKFYTENGVNYRCFNWYISEARKAGEWNIDRVSIGVYRGVHDDEWCINTSRITDINSVDVESHTKGEIEGRRQVHEILAFLKKYVPGFKDVRLMGSGSTLGIRESRHIIGEYVMTADDVINGTVPEDAVFLCANSVDYHGRFGPKTSQYITIQNGEYYGVSFKTMIPKSIENLLVAGRCFSAESVAAAAVRVMPPCMAMGQAAGTAACMAVKNNINVRNISYPMLKKSLVNQGVFLV